MMREVLTKKSQETHHKNDSDSGMNFLFFKVMKYDGALYTRMNIQRTKFHDRVWTIPDSPWCFEDLTSDYGLAILTMTGLTHGLHMGGWWKHPLGWFMHRMTTWLWNRGLYEQEPWPKFGNLNVMKVLDTSEQEFEALLAAMDKRNQPLQWCVGSSSVEAHRLNPAQTARFIRFLQVYLRHVECRLILGSLLISCDVATVVRDAYYGGVMPQDIVLKLNGSEFEPGAEAIIPPELLSVPK